MTIEFRVDKEKVVEALVFIAERMGTVGRFHAAKALYFADLEHLRRYGRPVTGDRYIAMENGPVPSFAYDVLKGSVSPADRDLVVGALVEAAGWRHPMYRAGRSHDADVFSSSDIECLEEAVEHCRGKSFGDISDETHDHEGWKRALENGPMDFRDMLIGAPQEIIDEAEASSAYAVL